MSPAPGRHVWLDVTAGVAGDMLLGALVDAGADLAAVQRAVDAVVPGSVRLERSEVVRAGLRAAKVDVVVLVDDPPHRRWTEVRAMLTGATLDPLTRARALDAFALLARAEGRVHGTSPEDVHFHEVGALDSVADVVGVCEALRLLDVGTVSATAIAVGAGRARVAHGDVPVPVPAVAELVLGWPVTAGVPEIPDDGHEHHPHDGGSGHAHGHDADHHGHHAHDHDHAHGDSGGEPGDPLPAAPARARQVGELATPTGVALVRALATSAGVLPAMTPEAVGVGAGTKDVPGRPNVVRVVLGQLASPRPVPDPGSHDDAPGPAGSHDVAPGPAGSHDVAPGPAGSHDAAPQVVQLEANVDDLDPRLWPGVLSALLGAGAVDAWLSPILMKKGRPAHTVHALCPAGAADDVATTLFTTTSTIGVRQHAPLHRRVLGRTWQAVDVGGAQVRVKVAHDTVVVRQVTPEFDDVVAAAAQLALPERIVLDRARLAADEAGLRVGGALHEGITDTLPDAPPQEER
ncbi:LarC family nickel insertion protein [Georgenia sp. M64]|uniref:LarC family nickel insertion protein n=1 Tax=Georgenia sp. M64 TaxID=3120520 RepID=UPI0030E0B04A